MDLLGPVQGLFASSFYNKENKRKQDKKGTLPDIHLATTEKERKADLLQYIVRDEFKF